MAKTQSSSKSGDAVYILAYILSFISGIIVYAIAQSDARKRFHGLQAIVLGVVGFILSFIPFVGGIIALLIWLYGLYIGIEGYNGNDVLVPALGDWAKATAGYKG